jgi:hypothetical protein
MKNDVKPLRRRQIDLGKSPCTRNRASVFEWVVKVLRIVVDDAGDLFLKIDRSQGAFSSRTYNKVDFPFSVVSSFDNDINANISKQK